jgi:hypothetical protein
MLRIRLSITLFNKRKTCELANKNAVYILESLRKAPDTRNSKRPFVCITGYNGMATYILEERFEDFPQDITIKHGIAYDGNDKNICWPILNKNLETEQIAVFSGKFLNDGDKVLPVKHFYQASTINKQSLFADYSTDSSYSEHPANLIPAPAYEPELWNNNINILVNNNCYTYALNIKGFRRYCGKDPNRTSFGNIVKNCLADNLHIVSTVTDTDNKHLIALFASSPFSSSTKTKTDYHFFRRDANGEWSHKNGHCNVTNRDFSGRIIKDVMACDRGRFQYFIYLFNVTANTIEKVSKRI